MKDGKHLNARKPFLFCCIWPHCHISPFPPLTSWWIVFRQELPISRLLTFKMVASYWLWPWLTSVWWTFHKTTRDWVHRSSEDIEKVFDKFNKCQWKANEYSLTYKLYLNIHVKLYHWQNLNLNISVKATLQ